MNIRHKPPMCSLLEKSPQEAGVGGFVNHTVNAKIFALHPFLRELGLALWPKGVLTAIFWGHVVQHHFSGALPLGDALWAVAWIASGKTSHIRVCPLVLVAGVFLAFGQLVDKWSTSIWDDFCLPRKCNSFHSNKMKEKFSNLIPFGSSQGLSKILSALDGKSWGFYGSKWRKLIFHVPEGSSLLPTICLPWRTFSCSEHIYAEHIYE